MEPLDFHELIDTRGAEADAETLTAEEISEVQKHLAAPLRSLRPAQEQLLRWRYVDGLSINQIAKLEGVTRQAIQNRLRRAHDRLRRQPGSVKLYIHRFVLRALAVVFATSKARAVAAMILASSIGVGVVVSSLDDTADEILAQAGESSSAPAIEDPAEVKPAARQLVKRAPVEGTQLEIVHTWRRDGRPVAIYVHDPDREIYVQPAPNNILTAPKRMPMMHGPAVMFDDKGEASQFSEYVDGVRGRRFVKRPLDPENAYGTIWEDGVYKRRMTKEEVEEVRLEVLELIKQGE